MHDPIFTGVCTALVTPFLNGEVNYPMLERVIARQLEGGVHAIVLCGTTGEAPTLTDEEKRDIIVSMIMGLAIILIIISMAGGGTKIQYYPTIQIPGGNQFLYVGMIGYALFLFLPSIIQMGEDITWYILKSKI